MNKLHLVTQRNQPYGSRSKCCERCGLAIFAFPKGDKYTDEEIEYTKKFASKFNLKQCVISNKNKKGKEVIKNKWEKF